MYCYIWLFAYDWFLYFYFFFSSSSSRGHNSAQCRSGHRSGGLHHQETEAWGSWVCKAGDDLQWCFSALLLHALHSGLWKHQPGRHQYPLHHWVSQLHCHYSFSLPHLRWASSTSIWVYYSCFVVSKHPPFSACEFCISNDGLGNFLYKSCYIIRLHFK